MFKSIVQSIVATFAAVSFALGWPIELGYGAMILFACIAAFEEKRWLSAVEVFFAATTIATCANAWYFGLIGAGLLAIWNIAQWIYPLKAKLMNAG